METETLTQTQEEALEQIPAPEKKKRKRKLDAVTARRLKMIKARHKRIIWFVFILCISTVLVASVIAGGILLKRNAPTDDGLIFPNVYVGGVNIGGMTPEDAEMAIQLSVIPVLTGEDMVVQLPNDTLRISPEEASISLDVDALLDAAYRYGRDGSWIGRSLRWAKAESSSYHIALLPYLSINTGYVYSSIQDFCDQYSTALVQPTVVLQGDRPEYGVSGSGVKHQILVITMGSPESSLSPDAIYDRVLDGYSMLDMEQEYETPVTVEPHRPNAQSIFDDLCQLPQDATIDNDTFAVTPEVYGYGFHVETVQRQIDRAEYGQVIEVNLDFLLPDITVNALNTNLFKETLATYVSKSTDGTNTNRDKNLSVACAAINGYVLKSGESFDLDKILGARTKNKGYVEAPIYSGSNNSVVGGGINQVASVLYYCAMQAGLTINERHAHRYAVTYTPLGTDASITYGSESLVFTNNTSAPIRILATTSGGTVTITFLGTDHKDYTVKLETVVTETLTPNTVYQYMDKDNVFKYVDGQVIQTAQIGYVIEVYVCKYDKKTGTLLERVLLENARYESRDRTVVKIITQDVD